MKMKKEHYDHLNKEITTILNKYNDKGQLIHEYEDGQFARSKDVKDLNKRWCFDLLYGAGLTTYACDVLYPYLNDDTIYTALKRICPTLARKY